MDKSIFWDINRTRSYNAMLNFIVGARGCGKTYGFKKWAIADFIKTGAQFVYCRRFKTEVGNDELDKFYTDIELNNEFPDHKLSRKGKTFYIDDKPAGFVVVLSTSSIKKSVAYPAVNKICFDEFIIDKSVYHYLPNEVTLFMDFISTVARLRDNVSVWCLSNAITINNPYFDYFGLTIPYGSDIARKGDVLIEVTHNPAFVDVASQTRFGRLVAGTPYGEYAIQNQFLRDNKNFVGKKSANDQYYFTLRYHGRSYGIYADMDRGILTASLDADETFPVRFCLTADDHTPNTLLIRGRRNPYISNLLACYTAGALQFETVKIKGELLKAIALLRV